MYFLSINVLFFVNTSIDTSIDEFTHCSYHPCRHDGIWCHLYGSFVPAKLVCRPDGVYCIKNGV